MPIYKMDGKKDGLQKYRVRINYVDREGKNKQLERVAYGKDQAKDLERKLNMELKSGELTTSRMTLQELYEEYIKVKATEIRESSVNEAKNRLSAYVLSELKDFKLDKLNASVMQKWKLHIDEMSNSKSQGKKLSATFKQSIYAAFRAMLNYAVKMEYIQKNPLVIVGNFRNSYEQKHDMDFYTPDEFKKFIKTAKEQATISETKTNSIFEWHYYMFFCIAFYTGMRKGEISALKWTDIDNNIIHIRRSITQKLKGDDRETPPKNKSSVRDIQIPLPLLNVLNEHRIRCEQLDGYSTDWRICGGPKSLRDTTVQNRNIAYATAAGVKQIRIHDFRHSHASLLANNGINIQEIARRLGHSNVEITWSVYSHLYPKEEERAMKVLNEVYF